MAADRVTLTMNRIKLLFFATLRDRAGTRSEEIEISGGTTVAALKERIAKMHPAMAESVESALIAINREYADVDAVVPDGAEVALFPPVSGGNHVQESSG